MKFESYRTLFVVNPRSAGGKTGKAWKTISPLANDYLKNHESKMTEWAGHATEITRSAIKSGFEMIVSVGGDGTNNEVINGFFENGKLVRKDVVFATIPRGTGCDFARGMKISKKPAEAFRILAGKKTRPMDVGKIEYSEGGKPAIRYFMNIAGFGASGDVVARVNRSGKTFGGFVSFLSASVASMVSFKNPKVAISYDGEAEQESVVNVVFVCNAQYCGGGMLAGPEAQIDDGMFDVTVVGDMTKTEALLAGRLLYNGKIYTHPKVKHVRARKITARSLNADVLLEADGEQPGILPATYSIVPSAVQLKV